MDAALASGLSVKRVATMFDYVVSENTLRRHKPHLTAAMVELKKEREQAGPRSAMDRLEELYKRTTRILNAAEKEGRAQVSLSAVRELRGLVETIAKITGELDERPQVVVNLAESREWAQMQDVILGALAAHPLARVAVANALFDADLIVAGEIEA